MACEASRVISLPANRTVPAVGWTAPTSLLNMSGNRPVYNPRAARFFPDVAGLPADVLVTGGIAGDGRLEELAGVSYRSDALIFAGTAAELADLLADWQAAGLSGFRLRPGALPHDLTYVSERLVPELQRRGLFRTEYAGRTMRENLRS